LVCSGRPEHSGNRRETRGRAAPVLEAIQPDIGLDAAFFLPLSKFHTGKKKIRKIRELPEERTKKKARTKKETEANKNDTKGLILFLF
jgi:hypothetical protein